MRKLRSSLRTQEEIKLRNQFPENAENAENHEKIETFIPITYRQFLNRLPTPKSGTNRNNSAYLNDYIQINNTNTSTATLQTRYKLYHIICT